MSNYVYTTHPDVDSYAREPGWLDCLGAKAIRQGNHYILCHCSICITQAANALRKPFIYMTHAKNGI